MYQTNFSTVELPCSSTQITPIHCGHGSGLLNLQSKKDGKLIASDTENLFTIRELRTLYKKTQKIT